MNRALVGIIGVAALVPLAIAYAAMLGLGVHRHAPAWAVSASATLLLFGPPLMAAGAAGTHRALRFASVAAVWSTGVLLLLPVYFPGERRDAVATGIALVGFGSDWDGMARALASKLPEEPDFSEAELPVAESASAQPLEQPPPLELAADEIALPYEGEGRRLSVPVVFGHGAHTLEVYMMLDTGATYTTLPTDVLERLGAAPTESAPEIVLHTANGERDAHLVLLDSVWLGDQAVEGVAIATCDNCSSSDTVGLLGLNVAGGFNLGIDADRREVVFRSREAFDRKLDVKPFIELDASFLRFAGGRVEVEVGMGNTSGRDVGSATAAVSCGSHRWLVELGAVPAGADSTTRRRLPAHARCDPYTYGLDHAVW